MTSSDSQSRDSKGASNPFAAPQSQLEVLFQEAGFEVVDGTLAVRDKARLPPICLVTGAQGGHLERIRFELKHSPHFRWRKRGGFHANVDRELAKAGTTQDLRTQTVMLLGSAILIICLLLQPKLFVWLLIPAWLVSVYLGRKTSWPPFKVTGYRAGRFYLGGIPDDVLEALKQHAIQEGRQ